MGVLSVVPATLVALTVTVYIVSGGVQVVDGVGVAR